MNEKYPVRAFNEATTGPVLSHAEEIDALRREHPFVRSTYGNGFWVFTSADARSGTRCSTRTSSRARW